ncbi:MAG TPA: hypothetical protein VFX98_07820 [Longimicrobiaceae bacterium]|nr:hypothetical protein [Longimicrobiaceae bacterium]
MTLEFWAGIGAVVVTYVGVVAAIYNFVQFQKARRNLVAKMRANPELRSTVSHARSLDAATYAEVTALIEKETATLPKAEKKQILVFLRQPDPGARWSFVRSLVEAAHLCPIG